MELKDKMERIVSREPRKKIVSGSSERFVVTNTLRGSEDRQEIMS